MLAGFELATADSRVVAVNPVQPEDDPAAIREFAVEMKMFDYLHGVYPGVSLTLHAGELTDGQVPPEYLRFHIRQSIEIGHARRIGHGVAIAWERFPELLRRRRNLGRCEFRSCRPPGCGRSGPLSRQGDGSQSRRAVDAFGRSAVGAAARHYFLDG